MVAHRSARLAAALPILVMLFGGLARATAETVTSVTIDSSVGVYRTTDQAALSALTKGSLDIGATANRNVRADLRLDATAGDGIYLSISRAYTTVRLPWLRFMIGKNRVSFGHGFLFDAGDVIFGGFGTGSVDLSASVLRDDTTWLGEVYLPLGPFAYAEAVVLPHLGPAGLFSTQASGSLVSDVSLLALPVTGKTLSAGGRIAGRVLDTDVELGYLYNGAGGLNIPYISAAGSLWVDWYGSASLTIPAADADLADSGKRVAVSFGMFRMFRPTRDATITARLEAAFIPAGQWTEAASGLSSPPVTVSGTWPSAADVTSSFTSRYGLYLYPEIDYAPSSTLSFQLRSIVSPIDLSATIIGSTAWNVYQGLTLQMFVFAMAGDATDVYGWARTGGVGTALAVEFVY